MTGAGASFRASNVTGKRFRARRLLIQSQLMRGSGNPVSLRRAVGKCRQATRERLPRKFAFAKHCSRSYELDPSIRVTRRLFQAIGKTIDHISYHQGAICRQHGLRGLHVLRCRSFVNRLGRLRSVACPCDPAQSFCDRGLLFLRKRAVIDPDIAPQLADSVLELRRPRLIRIGVLQ